MSLECLGVDDEVVGFDFMSLLKKEGPTLVTNVSEELAKKDDKKGDKKGADKSADKTGKGGKAAKSSGGNWFIRPVLGPLPGVAVVGVGAALATGLGFAIKKLVSR